MMHSLKRGTSKTLAVMLSVAITFTTYGGLGTVKSYATDTKTNLPSLDIASVEELVGGDVQTLYRDSVFKGDANQGQDPDKYYTSLREINLKDPRVFNFEFKVDAETVGDNTEEFLDDVDLQYGGLDLDKWVWDGFDSRYAPSDKSVLELKDKEIVNNDDGTYTVKVAMETKNAWTTSKQDAVNNIPYDNYGAGRQFDFGTGQSADNRKWWQAGPLKQGVDTYTMTATVDGEAVASTDIHIGPYDGMYSWIEINEYAQSLIKAINGSEYPIDKLDGQTTGTVAKGYVKTDEDGNFVKGDKSDSVYVEVSVIGYGLTDNSKKENQDFNNYSKYNAIWNVAVARDAETVDKYLNETIPEMNTNPQAIIDKIEKQNDEDIDLMQVFYQNNVHPDEVSGTDAMIRLTTNLIKGGKEGQNINYKTWTLDDMDLNYRDPAEGYNKGNKGHVVKGGYDEEGRFMKEGTRTEKVFDTKEALDNFIFVSTLCSNPDGKAGMRRTNRYAFDLNRDASFSTMPETIALMNDIMKWDPLVENEWHGYVTDMLIEPCTAPHDPAYDYDLLQNTMLNLSYAGGLAVTGSTGMQRFEVPWDHRDGGDWDDGGTIYSPMFAMLLGCYGYTIEFPYSNLDSLEANDVLNYGMIDELLHGETEFFPGNRLNGVLDDVNGKKYASHEEDIKYDSMRKATLIGKLTTKVRGINNIDAKETVDKYFIDKKKNKEGVTEDKVVGRARPKDANGNELSFFPDYIVVPTDEENQYNVAEGIKAMNQMLGWNIKVEMSTEDVKYDGKTIPAGAYVLDLKQAYRNVIFEVMSRGYDATGFSDMYADIYCNLPDVRGFDSIQIYGENLFEGKTKDVNKAEKKANITGTPSDYIVFKSQSTDAVRFVNLLLSGHSSGPSTSEKGEVYMLRKSVDGVGTASDYIIPAKDLDKIKNLKDNHVLGLNGCHIEGKYIDALPEEAVKLVDPVIQLNTVRTAQSGGPLWWMLDEYLGFNSMADYNGSSTLREGANVIIANKASSLDKSIVDAVNKGTGIIFINNASALTDENFGTGSAKPSTKSFNDVAVNGQYNVDDSIFTANYAKTSTYYARGNKFYNLPEGAKVLFQSDADKNEAFIGGFQATQGQKDIFANAVTMFSTIIGKGDTPAQALVIGQQLDNRPHYQKLLPLLATAIYAEAAGIYDDQNDPIINEVKQSGKKFVFSASEADLGVKESGIKSFALYMDKNGEDQLIEKTDGAKITVTPKSEMKVKAVVTDFAGNTVTKNFVIGKSVQETTDINEAEGKTKYSVMTYSGKAKTPAVTVKYQDKDLVEGEDFTVEYSDNVKVGTATATVKGINKFSGTMTLNFKIKPMSTFITSLKAGTKSMTVKYKKVTVQNSGYYIRYSTKSSFSTYKTVKVTSAKTKSKVIKSLKAGKYYVKVRTYKTVDGSNYYGSWSKAKSVRVK